MKVAILGGGITGLMCGWLLQQKGHEVTILERDEIPGGLCRSCVIDGFTFDRAGGHIIFSKDQEVMQVYRDLLGEDAMVRTERHTKIFYRGDFVKYPFENGLGDLPAEDKFQCLKGYVEAHYARENGAPQPDNFRDWVLWRFGQGIADCFMFPYNEKIWKIDLSELGTEWVAGRVPDAPVEDVLRSVVGISTEGYKHQAIFWYPIEGGFQAITDRLVERVGASLRCATPVEQVRKTAKGFEVNGDAYDRVINTIPLQECYKRLEDADSEGKAAAERLVFRGVTSFMIGLGVPEKTNHSWIYLPHPENGPANRITHLANYSPRNAPEGKSSILAEVTYEGKADIQQKDADAVVDGLHETGIIDKNTVELLDWRSNHYSYIVFTRDFAENRDAAIRGLEDAGIDTVGRFGRYDYHNSDMCIRSATDLIAKYPSA